MGEANFYYFTCLKLSEEVPILPFYIPQKPNF